jgi:hypothetical protein
MKNFKKFDSQFNLILIKLMLLIGLGCKKFIEVDSPTTSLNEGIVYGSDATSIAVLNGIYVKMGSITEGVASMSLFPALSADELTLWSGKQDENVVAYYQNNIKQSDLYWQQLYNIIFLANSAIEGIGNSKTLTPAVKTHLLGEAKFMRAFCYFYLVNLYGDVPLAVSSNYSINSKLSRAPKKEVYKLMIEDLKEAQLLLVANYVDGSLTTSTDDRSVPNKGAATALLARVYLYNEEWKNADDQATDVINQNEMYNLENLKDVFLINSKEAIWQLKSVRIDVSNTFDAILFKIPVDFGPNISNDLASATGGNWVYVSKSLNNSFEPNDGRKLIWLDSVTFGGKNYVFPVKYKNNTLNSVINERMIVMRLAEQYLIRSEARAKLGDLIGAKDDINRIRSRANLLPVMAENIEGILLAISKERRSELFTEWGHRWFDLKRTKKVDEIMIKETSIKGGTWLTTSQLFPINYQDIRLNPNIIQNPGY